jgi:hypothetical protein
LRAGSCASAEADTLDIAQYWPDAYCPQGSSYDITVAACTFHVRETQLETSRSVFQNATGAILSGGCTRDTPWGPAMLTVESGTLTFDHASAQVDVTLAATFPDGAGVLEIHFSGPRSC